MAYQRVFHLTLLFATLAMPVGAAEPTSHDADIDRARDDVRTAPTTTETHRERSLLMFLWLAA